MTAETARVPQQAGSPPGPPDGNPPPPRPPGARWWGHLLRRSVLVPLVLLTPLLTVAPRSDHRFNVYWHGGMFHGQPWRIVEQTVDTVDTYLLLGNFRPLGRMLEKALDLLAFVGMEQLHLPATVTLRAVSLLAAMLLTFAAVVLAESVLSRERLFRRPPSTVALLLPYAVGAGFVAAGPDGPVTLFGALYLTTAALVLLVAAAACRLDRFRWWHAAIAVPAGAALAAFNELAYLAVPLATAAVLLRGRLVLQLPVRALLTSAGVRFAALLWLGFLPVFGTVRWLIQNNCADGGCYRGSDLILDGRVVTLLPARMLAWLPPLQWQAATGPATGPWLRGVFPIAVLLLLAVLAWRTFRLLPGTTRPAPRALAALAGVAVVVLVLGAVPAALSAAVRVAYPGSALWQHAWRDTALTAPAGMLLVVAVALLLTRAGRPGAAAVLAGLVLCVTISATANRTYADVDARVVAPPVQLDNRIAQEMAAFDPGPAGNERRCALLDEALRVNARNAFLQRRYTTALEIGARALAGVPFCRRAPWTTR